MSQVKKWFSKNAVVVFLVVIVLAFGLSSATFFTAKNIINVISQMAINALIATGITFVIITGGIDIGVGSVAAFAGIFAANVGLLVPDLSIGGGLAIQIGQRFGDRRSLRRIQRNHDNQVQGSSNDSHAGHDVYRERVCICRYRWSAGLWLKR